MPVDEVGRVVPLTGARALHPQELVLSEMLDGWRRQQLCRNLSLGTIERRRAELERFAAHSQAWPWTWTPVHVEEFCSDLRVKGRARSSVRQYQDAIRGFCSYVSRQEYGWVAHCEALFGAHPSQVVTEWNTAAHVQDYEGGPAKRAFTRRELQELVDHADDEVVRLRRAGRKGSWAAWRDAVVIKTAYAWGLRANEVVHLQSVDLSPNPHAGQFRGCGVLTVRHGKAMRASGPKRRGVLTVFDWSPGVLEDWMRRGLAGRDGLDLFPSERGGIVSRAPMQRLARYVAELGMGEGLDFHSLRRSYATHLIEAGMDPLFVQQQLGHEHASTTALYTCVSSDFRTRTLAAALDTVIAEAFGTGGDAAGRAARGEGGG
jgi:site-specific recombinase XerD